MKKKLIRYVTGTGEVFMTDQAGVEYLLRMIEHIKGQYTQLDQAHIKIKELELKIKELSS